MSPSPELDTETGELRIAEPTLSVLVGHTTGHTAMQADVADARAEQELLRSAGVLDPAGRAAHPALGQALAAIANPEIRTLQLSYHGRTMLGWIGHPAAALLLPAAPDGRRKLTPLPLALVAGALARLVGLGERPHPEPAAAPVTYHGEVAAGADRHWRLVTGPAPADLEPRTYAVEVVDKGGGLWTLHPEHDGTLLAWPSTPTQVWRLIVRALTSTAPA